MSTFKYANRITKNMDKKQLYEAGMEQK